jgi:hypothetical protein
MSSKPHGTSWRGFVESTIRKAMAEGEFENLPGQGMPIEGLEEPYHEDWWIRSLLKREQLAMPCASLEIRRDVEKTLMAAGRLRTEAEVRAAVLELNARIARVNRLGSTGPATGVGLVDLETIVARWRGGR